MLRYLFVIAISIFLFASCGVFGKRVRGSGTIKMETRSAEKFSSVKVSGSIHVYLRQDSSVSIKVETDENLMEYVEISSSNDVLNIKARRGYTLRPSQTIKVYVAAPVFNKLTASGSCDFHSENTLSNSVPVAIKLSGASDADIAINAPSIKANLTGAGSLTLKGQTKDLQLDGTGSSKMRCIDMMAENVDVDITGAGNAEVFASMKLDVRVTGSGKIRYKGNPSVSQKVSGAGSVQKMD